MSAETLRRAAVLMRERAEAATTSPWEGGERCVWSTQGPDPYVVHDGEAGDGGAFSPANAEHIASWHPAVALAVADWLDDHAETAELFVAKEIPASTWSMNWQTSHNRARALAVARAYLGEAS